MGSLILAGESICILPYLRKSFQTSMEATFGLSAFEVGTLNALFGVLDSLVQTARIPEVWLITVVICWAYLMFQESCEFPAYAEHGFERSKEFGASLGAARDWPRPIAAIAAGLIADRVSPSRAISVLFAAWPTRNRHRS